MRIREEKAFFSLSSRLFFLFLLFSSLLFGESFIILTCFKSTRKCKTSRQSNDSSRSAHRCILNRRSDKSRRCRFLVLAKRRTKHKRKKSATDDDEKPNCFTIHSSSKTGNNRKKGVEKKRDLEKEKKKNTYTHKLKHEEQDEKATCSLLIFMSEKRRSI